MATRREFLKALGGVLGSVILTSCGGSSGGGTPGGGSVTPIPNAYRFFRLTPSGGQLPDGGTIDFFSKAVLINERSEIVFSAWDNGDAKGFYELTMDFSGPRPTVARLRSIVREGDQLGDSRKVLEIGNADINDEGSFAAILITDDNLTGIYLEKQKSGLRPAVRFGDSTPAEEGVFGSMFADLDLHNSDNLLFVGHYSPHGSVYSPQGVFHLPGGELNASGKLVLSTGEMIPEAVGILSGFGLVDMHDEGNFVLQSFGQERNQVSGASYNARNAASMLIRGNVHRPYERELKIASPSLKVARPALVRQGFAVGEVIYGPRIGGANDIASVFHVGDDGVMLYYDDRYVSSTGGFSPLHNMITGFSGPVVGGDRLLYYQVYTDSGAELVAYNGVEHRSILSKGDVIEGKKISAMWFGISPEQVDKAGRVVLVAEFDDGSNSIVVGTPV